MAPLLWLCATLAGTAAGSRDTALSATVVGTAVHAAITQTDGKIILAGAFTSVGGTARNNIARIFSNGTLDTGFNPNANSTVYNVVLQKDGKILICGDFTAVQPNGAGSSTPRQRIARLMADGTVDQAFDPKANSTVKCLALQEDGKILVGGGFTSFQPNGTALTTTRNRIARLNADGTLDAGLNPNANNEIRCITVQQDGKVLAGGAFTSVQPPGAALPIIRNRICRLETDGSLDTGFNPNADSTVHCATVQRDGKVLLGGAFTTFQPNGSVVTTARNRIARLNRNGTVDLSFDPNAPAPVNAITVQINGKLLIGGAFINFTGTNSSSTRKYLARLNADGSLDTTFSFLEEQATGEVFGISQQADGKILACGAFPQRFPYAGAVVPAYFCRVSNESSAQNLTVADIRHLSWTRSGAGPELTLVTFDLSTDSGANWSPLGKGTPWTTGWHLSEIELPASGRIRATGQIPGGNGGGSSGLISQELDFADFSTFAPDISIQGNGITIPAADLIPDAADNTDFTPGLRVGSSLTHTFTIQNTARFNTLSFNRYQSIFSFSGPHALDFTVDPYPSFSGGSSLYGGSSRDFGIVFTPKAGGIRQATVTIASNDRTEPAYSFAIQGMGIGAGNLDSLDLRLGSGSIYATAEQPDGKILLAGGFTSVLGVPRFNIARLNADGTLDMGFNPIADDVVVAVVVQPDGKILICGRFYNLKPNGAATTVRRTCLARLQQDGTVDPGFQSDANTQVRCMALQPNGKIVIGGDFTLIKSAGVNSITRNYLARVNADGTVDVDFNPSANNLVRCIHLQEDGGIIIGGDFTYLRSTGATSDAERRRCARIRPDGTLDPEFIPNPGGLVQCITGQSDGKILLGGDFTGFQPAGTTNYLLRERFARLNRDGTVDTAFYPNADNTVRTLVVQADGRILLGGEFGRLRPNGAASPTFRSRLARINPAGTMDEAFDPVVTGGTMRSVMLLADGGVLIGGEFTNLQPNGADSPSTRKLFARLFNETAAQTLTVPDATHISWQRSGAAPEVSGVTFELSTDTGVTWTPLGRGNWKNGGWILSDLKLLVSGSVRARGRTSGGNYNSSSGIVEQITAFSAISSDVPDIRVTGKETLILTGDPVPDVADHTDFGLMEPAGGTIERTFTIQNTGMADLVLSGTPKITLSGTHAADFTVLEQPVSFLAPGGITTFRLSFDPSAYGVRTATVLISNNDTDEGLFNFSIRGKGADTPGLEIPTATRISATAATLNGRVINDGGEPVTERGFVYSATHMNQTPVIGGNGVTGILVSGTTGSYTVALTDLSPGSYTFRTYATNARGTAYTETVIFVTPAAAAGDLDPLNPAVTGSYVTAMAVQPDGKIILAGTFTSIRGVARQKIARLHPDGSLDLDFATEVSGDISSLSVLPQGDIILAGDLYRLRSNPESPWITPSSLARLREDGTVDTGFQPASKGYSIAVAVQADRKVIIGRSFAVTSPNEFDSLRRVNIDGSDDPSFLPDTNGFITKLIIDPVGRLIVGGHFTMVFQDGAGGAGTTVARPGIARFHADGTLDKGFSPIIEESSSVDDFALQRNQGLLLSGRFGSLAPSGVILPASLRYMVRLNPDGKKDSSFLLNPLGDVYAAAQQADGKILIGGNFTSLGPNEIPFVGSHRYMARAYPNGTLDAAFSPGPNREVFSLGMQSDGKVLMGGLFDTLGPVDGATTSTPRKSFALLRNDRAIQNLTTPDRSHLFWTRGGSAPEIQQATFELSTDDGATWQPLGTGTYRSGGWELGGLTLPDRGRLRAEGGVNIGKSSSLIRQVEIFDFETTALERYQNYIRSNSSLTGSDAAPAAEPFQDGVKNLLKYAFNLNPDGPDRQIMETDSTTGLPFLTLQNSTVGRTYRLEFVRRIGSGLSYNPQQSSTLSPSSWQPLTGTPAVTSINALWERVVYEEPLDHTANPVRFITVAIALP